MNRGKPSNGKLGILTLPIAYLKPIQDLIEQGETTPPTTDKGYVGPLAKQGKITGAFKYEKGTPKIIKEKELKIININQETFKIQIL